VIYAVLQFIGSTQVLEVHYFLVVVGGRRCCSRSRITIARGWAPRFSSTCAIGWLIPVVLLAVPLVFELQSHGAAVRMDCRLG